MDFNPVEGAKELYSTVIVSDESGSEHSNNYNFATLHWETASNGKVNVWVVFKEQVATDASNNPIEVDNDPVMLQPSNLEWAHAEFRSKARSRQR